MGRADVAQSDPGSRPDRGLTIRGELSTTSVPELLRSVLSSGETGVLTFRNGEFTKKVYVRQGRVVFASSTNPDERLGESLMVRGQITARQFIEASRQVRPGRRLGAILVELEALSPDELIAALEHQVSDILLDLFTWTQGEYQLVITETAENVAALNVPTENIILEGVRRMRSWRRVHQGISDIESVLFPTGNTDVLYKLELTPEEQEVLAHVNGRSTVEQICQVSYLSNFETCRILWALQVLGVIRRGRAPGAEAPAEAGSGQEEELELEAVVEKFNQMFSGIYSFLKGRIGDEADRFMDSALEQVAGHYGLLFEGVDLKPYGRADFEQMLANVADLPPPLRRSLMVAGLNELVFAMQLVARSRHGREEEAVVSGMIKDGMRKLAPGLKGGSGSRLPPA